MYLDTFCLSNISVTSVQIYFVTALYDSGKLCEIDTILRGENNRIDEKHRCKAMETSVEIMWFHHVNFTLTISNFHKQSLLKNNESERGKKERYVRGCMY